MAPKSPLLLLLPLLFLTTASAFNITLILNQFPELGQFNSYLSQTKLADQINSRTTITVLAVDNSSMAALSSLPLDQLKSILSVHVILDYYDSTKFQNLKKPSTIITTLYQASGDADARQGFLNMTKFSDGAIVFGSAMPKSPVYAKVVGSVAAKPYNISVLQVSSVIVPPGLANVSVSQQSSYVPQQVVAAPPPAEAPEAEAPVADAPEADAPVADAPSPAADAPSPVADAPGPAAADAPGPAVADDEQDKVSGAGRVAVGAGFGVLISAVGAVFLGECVHALSFV